MCLRIIRQKTKPLPGVVYKYYRLTRKWNKKGVVSYDIAPPHRFHCKYNGVAPGTCINSDRENTTLTNMERCTGNVNRGIHTLTNVADAMYHGANNAIGSRSRVIIVQVLVHETDKVASGVWDNWVRSEEAPSEVYTKIEINKVVAILGRNGKPEKL